MAARCIARGEWIDIGEEKEGKITDGVRLLFFADINSRLQVPLGTKYW